MTTYIDKATFAPLASTNANDARLLEVIAQASAWVDTVYSGIAPFASIGSGKRAQMQLAAPGSYDDMTLTLTEGLPEALSAGDQLQLENYTEAGYGDAVGRGRLFSNYDSRYAGYADYTRQDFTVYRLSQDHAQGATTLHLSSGIRVPIDQDRHVVIGTPPTITAAAELYALHLWLIPIRTVEQKRDNRIDREKRAEKLLGVKDGKAYNSPHPLLWR